MIPINQEIIDKNDGDCTRAVIASLFNLTIQQVPHFIRYESNWLRALWNFIDYILNYKLIGAQRLEKYYTEYNSLNGFFYVAVKSKNFENTLHAVVCNLSGYVVHDPHPNKKWYGKCIFDNNGKFIDDFDSFTIIRKKEKGDILKDE